MSRALDPQLHTHVVAANLTRGPDGRFTALHGALLYRAAKTGGYLYQAHLRAEIAQRLGWEWGPVSKGAAELRGVPAAVVQEFSRRRHEMQRAAADGGGFSLGSKRSAEAAAVDTRERKQYGVETHTWREDVEARAAEHGLGHDQVAELVARGVARLASAGRSPDPDIEDSRIEAGAVRDVGDRLVGPTGLTERANTFDERAVLQEFAQAAGQGARVAVVRGWAEEFSGRADVLGTHDGAMTTRDLVGCERRLIDSAVGRADERCAVVAATVVDRAIAGADRRLTAEQEGVVRACATGGHGVQAVQALAGTGKTYTAGVLRSLYEAAGYRVLGLAPTGRGARELAEEAGLAAWTIDRALIDIEQLGHGLPERAVIVLDEAGMAPTRLTARLLDHAARAGAKVIAIGDSGQLPSVLAGGWLRAVGERVGALELTEVMRQRDPGERRALGALHDGLPDLYLGWAAGKGRIEVVGGDTIAERAAGEWVAAAADHAPGQAVMIARDNDTRDRLNDLARAHLTEAGELGDQRAYGAVSVAVGDRVICRENDRWVGVENGTRGTVGHVDAGVVVLATDSGLVRELPAGYVCDHVEHAYCLTGHGMQGATVEAAIVVASPEDLTAGWSYSALSRARGQTRLLIAGADRREADRAEHAPEGQRRDRDRGEVLARAARRMLVRDDQDLAIDQLRHAGHDNDRALATDRAPRGLVPQERAAARAEPVKPVASHQRLIDLRDQISRLQLTLDALPTKTATRFDALEARARDLTARRAEHHDQLAGLAPPIRRFGRTRDPDADQRALLQTAIRLDDRALADLAADRRRLQRELGDPDQIRSERNATTDALHQLQREHHQLRSQLADAIIDRRPEWLIHALGHRPQTPRDRETWDRAARTLTSFRLDHDIADHGSPLGPEPAAAGQRRERNQAAAALERARRHLGRDPLGHHRERDLGID
jgi:hypothetical protein